jgi:GNAT superfamily N-acetyltransferase
MKIDKKEISAKAVKLYVEKDGKEIARAYLYIIKNDLHPEPYGFLEDVFVDESLRGQGIGTELVNRIVAEAKAQGCYKFIATSRYGREKVHALYEKLGFKNYGIEFRLDL